MIDIYNDCWENILPSIISKIKNPIIVTDPPFNINYHYNEYKDNKTDNEYYNWLGKLFSYCPFVCIHYPESLYKISYITGKFPERVVSWVYNSNTPRQHRDIAFFGITPDFNKITQPYKNINDKRIQKRISEGKKGAKIYDWWNINQIKNVSKNKNNINHPCSMPFEVMKRIIGILPEDVTIIDPFMGSGTTGMACKFFNKDFIGIEKDEKYFNISKQLMEFGFVNHSKENIEEFINSSGLFL